MEKTGEKMTANQEKGHKWVETKNYENFLENCRRLGRSKSQWVRKGCPKTKPNGEPIKAAASARGDD